MSPEVLVRQAAACGIPVLPLTDINNTMGIFEFVRLCRAHGIAPVAGADIRTGDRMLYTLLARDLQGFGEINAFLSRHNLSRTPFPRRAPLFDNVFVIYPCSNLPSHPLRPHEYAGISPNRRLSCPSPSSRTLLLHPVTFAGREEYLLHRHLRAIHHNILLPSLTEQQTASPGEVFLSPRLLSQMEKEHPSLFARTRRVLESCSFNFDFSSPKNRKTFTGSSRDDIRLLRKLALDGMHSRYGEKKREAEKRILHELEIIGRLGFAAYFLITWDIIRYAMSRGFYHVGRGSGANSVVAYCLGITDVDPIDLNLYFERFINPRRSSPPDFDLDFSWKERDEVLEYLFMRYGREHTALLGALSTFRSRSLIRELGKV